MEGVDKETGDREQGTVVRKDKWRDPRHRRSVLRRHRMAPDTGTVMAGGAIAG